MRQNRAKLTGSRAMMSILADPDRDAIRREEFQGAEHLIVPVVMLKEQVLHAANAEEPELALASEFGRFPQSWDGRPVVLDHPKRNGMPVSANSTDILEERAFGQIFNTFLEDNKLKAEMWINTEKVERLGESFKSAVDRLESGEEVTEVSTGLFTQSEPVEGVFQGERFAAIWRDVVPDHLAVLPEGIIGACSVADGCGAPRVNADRLESGEPISSVILGRSNTGGGGDGMACKCGANDPAQCSCDEKGIFQTLMQKFGHLLSFRSSQSDTEVKRNSSGLSDRDRRMALESALSTQNSDDFFFIVSVFDNSVVFERGFEGKLMEQRFEIRDDGKVVLSDEAMEVRPLTQFIPVDVATEHLSSDDDEEEKRRKRLENAQSGDDGEGDVMKIGVDDVIASESNGFTEEDRDFLSGLEETQLSKFVVEPPEAPTEGGDGSVDDGETATTEEELPMAASARKEPPQPKTAAEYIEAAPAEMQEVLRQGLRMQQQRRSDLIKGIRANESNQYSEEELKQMSLDYLEKLAALAIGPSYEGAGAVRTQSAPEDENAAPPMPELFPSKTA